MFVEYGELSTKLYHLTKPPGTSVGGDIDYYYRQLKNVKGKILEAGVGTGRVMIPFLKKGLHIEGVDLSKEMLQQCKTNLAKEGFKANLFQGDLTALNLANKYEAIIMPTGSFCLLHKVKVNEVLRSFYNHLETNGKLIVDIELPSWFIPNQVAVKHYMTDEKTGILFTSTAKDMDWHSQKTSYIHRYELVDSGGIKKTEISHFVLYWYGIDEFTLLLEKCGYSEIKYEAGYGKDSGASLITFFAERR